MSTGNIGSLLPYRASNWKNGGILLNFALYGYRQIAFFVEWFPEGFQRELSSFDNERYVFRFFFH